ILIIFCLIILGVGSFYFIQNKASSTSLMASGNSNYKINSIYLTVSTNGWKEYDYGNVKIKYPSNWMAKSFNLGDGERVGFTDSKNTTIVFASIDGSDQFSDCEDFLNQIVKQPGSSNSETGQNIPTKPVEFNKFSGQSSFSAINV